MRFSKAAERYAQLLARAGTRVEVRRPRVSYAGVGGDLELLWRLFKQELRDAADEPFRHEGALRTPQDEHL